MLQVVDQIPDRCNRNRPPRVLHIHFKLTKVCWRFLSLDFMIADKFSMAFRSGVCASHLRTYIPDLREISCFLFGNMAKGGCSMIAKDFDV